MNSMHVSEWIPAYALGTLTETEREGVASHLARCLRCQAELRAYQAVVDRLPEAISQRDPPAHLRAAILERITPVEEEPAPEKATARPAWLAWLFTPIQPAFAAIGLVLILILAGLNLVQWQQNRAAAQATPAAAAQFQLVRMTPPQSGGASGLLVISDNGEYGTLVVDGLETLSAQQQYQLWLIQDGKRTSGGVFSVQDSGYGMLRVESAKPLNQYQSFGVTVEPFGGSPGPTGKKVLGGSL